jgi:UDP-glucose-4-epimerase GalE
VGVIHLASLIHARDSGKEPDAYYRVNVGGTIILAALLAQLGNIPLILSSSAAVYGMPDVTPIPEDHPKRPISPYGKSKAMAEEILADLHKAYGLGGVILRYFNAAGADLTGEIGEAHPIERHLIPLLLTAEEPVELFGDDPVRDYVHVADLAEAHVAALEKALREPGTLSTYNLGTGRGYSVREVVQMAESVVGRPIPTIQRGRNSADPLTLVADASRARQELGWLPHNSDLFTIVSSAWSWHRKNAFHLAGHTS